MAGKKAVLNLHNTKKTSVVIILTQKQNRIKFSSQPNGKSINRNSKAFYQYRHQFGQLTHSVSHKLTKTRTFGKTHFPNRTS